MTVETNQPSSLLTSQTQFSPHLMQLQPVSKQTSAGVSISTSYPNYNESQANSVDGLIYS